MRMNLAFMLVLLAGCVQQRRDTNVQEMRGPSGAPGYFIQCWGNSSACLREAGGLCPNGYEVASKATGRDVNGVAQANENMSAQFQNRQARDLSVERYDLLVECS
jgi:hypothetical protein